MEERIKQMSKEEIAEHFKDIDEIIEESEKFAAAPKEVRVLLSLNYKNAPTTFASSPFDCQLTEASVL